MEHYFGVAREEGLTDEELGAVQSIVMAVSAGRVRAQFREARVRSKQQRRSKAKRTSDKH
ncbi:MAG: hypothetical protein JSW54_10750 [Fidelibacterota bacterium]|nr:MAG: hypothetical protein JSW54_10750 [Candidatus Neomarinimicrobiota bacterium]